MNETLVTLNIHIPPGQETVIRMGFLMEIINVCKGDASCSAYEKRAPIVNTTIFDHRKEVKYL